MKQIEMCMYICIVYISKLYFTQGIKEMIIYKYINIIANNGNSMCGI